jgi:hypothetical protein
MMLHIKIPVQIEVPVTSRMINNVESANFNILDVINLSEMNIIDLKVMIAKALGHDFDKIRDIVLKTKSELYQLQ